MQKAICKVTTVLQNMDKINSIKYEQKQARCILYGDECLNCKREREVVLKHSVDICKHTMAQVWYLINIFICYKRINKLLTNLTHLYSVSQQRKETQT